MEKRTHKALRGMIAFLPAFMLTGCTEKHGTIEIGQAETKNIDPWAYLVDTSVSTNGTIRLLQAAPPSF